MKIESFNATIDFWIDALDEYNDTQLALKPDEKSWSIGQLYMHILDDSLWYLGQIRAALGNKENAHRPTTPKAQTLLSNNALPNERIKGDPNSAEQVKQAESKTQLRTDLKKLKKETNSIWENIINPNIQKGKTKHPGLGFLNPEEWIQYTEMHLRHHFKQKSRIDLFLNP